jgi:hypothetical protein
MTDEQIIEMAREAGLHLPYWDEESDPETDPPYGWTMVSPLGQPLIAFAKLVAQHEREACAKLIESRKTGANELMDVVRDMEAKAIRARGEE